MKQTTQQSKVTLSAVVFPICVCGKPYPEHTAQRSETSSACGVYTPARPIEDYGVIAERRT